MAKKRLKDDQDPKGPYIKRCSPPKDEDIPLPVEDKPEKQEYAIATYLKKHCPVKRTKFLNHQVNYFYANKAVDVLLDSPWASGKEILFTDRESVVEYCNKLLKHKFFHRARKIPITDKDLKPKDLKRKKEKEKEEKEKKKKEVVKKKAPEKEEEKSKEEESQEEVRKEVEEIAGKTEDNEEKDDEKEKKKKKKKIKLDMHLDQEFIDGADAYVWMYDPVPFWYYIAGGLILIGAIAVCLFPLWPPGVRKCVYYLSVAAAGFLGVILGLAVIRFIVFVIIWVLSMGYHHLWLLPNLTEDVGFFASFWPLYHYEYRGDGYEKKKKKKKASKDDDDQDQDDSGKKSDGDNGLDSPDTAAETDKPETDVDRVHSEDQTAGSETDSENSNSQAFEIIEKEDVDGAHETGDENGESKKDSNTEEGDEEKDVLAENSSCS
ncbi:translocation protein SEC62-like isoform X3 [Penaeus japonicus]|uniref:translocation protein SEC62-like isoform X3 n=1 Tax=Penaeus japonicus TaxID=27405 RepID=UPI001C7140CB|nr:translocation protein SEC62-like isoform X3 [Penaeus japonicus]